MEQRRENFRDIQRGDMLQKNNLAASGNLQEIADKRTLLYKCIACQYANGHRTIRNGPRSPRGGEAEISSPETVEALREAPRAQE